MKTPMNELIDKATAYSRELSTEGYLYESFEERKLLIHRWC